MTIQCTIISDRHTDHCDGRALVQTWCEDGTEQMVYVSCTGCLPDQLVCAASVRGTAPHQYPHCGHCGQLMSPGALDTRDTGRHQRHWICEPCGRSAAHADPLQDARVPQRVLI